MGKELGDNTAAWIRGSAQSQAQERTLAPSWFLLHTCSGREKMQPMPGTPPFRIMSQGGFSLILETLAVC